MNTLENIVYYMTGHGLIEALAKTLRENDNAFVESEKGYTQAVAALREQLPTDFTPSLDDYIAANERDIISRVAYAGYLGYRVNIENFHHPVKVEFLHEDTIDYVKDHIIGHFPVSHEAARIKEAFFKSLPEALKTYEDAITDYFIHMECSGPKLAHYAGYVIANNLLSWVEPGYRADWFQSDRFRDQVKEYMGYLPL